MPCREWFDDAGPVLPRDACIPPTVKARVSVEAGVGMGWREFVGDHGRIVSIDHYGASADYARIYQEFGVTARGRRQRRPRQPPAGHGLSVPRPGYRSTMNLTSNTAEEAHE